MQANVTNLAEWPIRLNVGRGHMYVVYINILAMVKSTNLATVIDLRFFIGRFGGISRQFKANIISKRPLQDQRGNFLSVPGLLSIGSWSIPDR